MNYRKLIIRAIFVIVIIFIIALGIMRLMDRNIEHNTGESSESYVRGPEIGLQNAKVSSRWAINGPGGQFGPENLIDDDPEWPSIVTSNAQNPDTGDGEGTGDGAWVSAEISEPDKLIGDVLLYNRTDDLAYQRFLGNFGVWLSNTGRGDTGDGAHHCGNYTSDTTGFGPFKVNCGGRQGRWVTVKQIRGPLEAYWRGLRFLTPSELEVYEAVRRVSGCMRQGATNYDSAANVDSGNCNAPQGTVWHVQEERYVCQSGTGRSLEGLTPNRNGDDTIDANCGQRRVPGCTISTAFNYNPDANVNVGCIGPAGTVLVNGAYVCRSGTGRLRAGELPIAHTFNSEDMNCGQVLGCTDSTALNYNSNATVNDNSCRYGITDTIIDTNVTRNLGEQARFNNVNIGGCFVSNETINPVPVCDGVKISVSRNVNNVYGGTRRIVRHLCCRDSQGVSALQNARNAERTLNNAYMNMRNTIGYTHGQAYNNSTTVLF